MGNEKSNAFRNARIAVLLSILALVAGTIEFRRARIRSWDRVLTVGVYPVITADTPEIRDHASSLSADDFAPVVAFLEREAARHGRRVSPPIAQFLLGKPISERPPELAADAGPLDIIRWSLALRAYSLRVRREHGLPDADVEMFIQVFPPGSPRTFDASVAVERLRVAVVNAEASPRARSWLQIAVAHELLHTTGATDKYLPGGAPAHPHGFADPDRSPRYPQEFCEIMAGQIPVEEGHFREPAGLDECSVGPLTAREINWSKGR